MSEETKEIIDPQMVEEIVEEIVSSMKQSGAASGHSSEVSDIQIAELREKVDALEKSFQTNEVEIERQVTEKFENVSERISVKYGRMESQIAELKIMVAKLADDLKKIKATLPAAPAQQ